MRFQLWSRESTFLFLELLKLLPFYHQALLEILEQYRSHAPSDEHSLVEELKEYVTEHEDCFERKCEDGARHIAAAVLLVTSDFRRALFLWHAKIQCWTQPGGHADGNPDIHGVALKELEEETGVTERIRKIPWISQILCGAQNVSTSIERTAMEESIDTF